MRKWFWKTVELRLNLNFYMNSTYDFHYFQGSSFSDLFAEDITEASYALILNYPATASWAAYPNTKKYFIQEAI